MSLKNDIQNYLSEKFKDHAGEFDVSDPHPVTGYKNGKAVEVERIIVQTNYTSKPDSKDDPTAVISASLNKKFGHKKRAFIVRFGN